MRKTYFRFLSLAFFFLGVFFLLNSKTDIIGAIVGISNISSGFSSIFGLVFVLISMIIFFSGESLEEKLEEESLWKKYDFDRAFMMAEDVKKGYLKRKKQSSKPTPIQEMIEKRITGGRIIQEPYREHTYSDHYERESKGGRIVDVPSHIETKGKNKGRLKYFNQFADGWYIWVVDDKGNFVVGDRVNTESKRYGHKLPHSVLANGDRYMGQEKY